jgi:hypothetical protein
MKTAKQFLEECKVKWSLIKKDNAEEAMIEALILYAEQAIDKCAEQAEIRTMTFSHPDPDEWEKVVDRSSIVKVKKLLK